MSKCISAKGEFSEHELDAKFTCVDCFAFDEDAALERIESLQAELAEWKQKAEDRLAAYNAKIQDFAQETRRTSALMAELAEAAAVIEQVRAWRDENQEHMVYEATDEEPAECTDECEWCPLDTILDAAPSSALDGVKDDAKAEERSEWADYFEHVSATVGSVDVNAEIASKIMRGPRPFGAAAALREGSE